MNRMPTGRRLPVRWVRTASPIEDWRIECGPSRFLVAHGSGWSAPIGRALFHELKWGQPLRSKQKKIRKTVGPR
jgi:hypothetical protein